MSRRLAIALTSACAAACAAFAAGPSLAQSANAAPAPAPGHVLLAPLSRPPSTVPSESAEPHDRAEPNVTHSVIEDKGSKIDQLTVRGQVTRVVVTPKIGLTAPYEILVGPEGRDPFGGGTGGARSAAGNRVWNILKF